MEKFIKKSFVPQSEDEKFIWEHYPNVLFFVCVKQSGKSIEYHCLTEDEKSYDIALDLFDKYYERVSILECKQKSEVDKLLPPVFNSMKDANPNWKNIKESISILKKKYPCFEAYIEIEYCKKQEELNKYEAIDA